MRQDPGNLNPIVGSSHRCRYFSPDGGGANFAEMRGGKIKKGFAKRIIMPKRF